MEHPELQLLIQKSIARDRLIERGYDQIPATEGNVSRVRNITGHMFVIIGERIAATPKPASTGAVDITTVNGVRNA